jgi:hypothetical protein
MNANDIRLIRPGTPLTVAATVLALALLVVGTRQVTIELAGGDNPGPPASAPVSDPGSGPASALGGAATATPGEPPATGRGAAGEPSPGGGEPDGPGVVSGQMSAGQVTVGEPYGSPAPDRITVQPGPVAARTALPHLPGHSPPDRAAPDGAGTPDGGSDGTGLERPDVGDDVLAPIPLPFAVGVGGSTTGHVATIEIGVDGGPDGLAALEVDLGDGNQVRLTGGQVDALRDGGTFTLVHEYRPTLIPLSWTVRATATDGAGLVRQASQEFQTRAAYLLSYSALAVTALNDCDTIGKGDFGLRWKLDDRPVRSSEFKLGKGETYVEDGFRVGVQPVHFGEPVPFDVSIVENDPWGARLFAVWRWDIGWAEIGDPPVGDGSAPAGEQVGPVAQIGSHQYPVTLSARDVESGGGDDCAVRMDFTVYLTMLPRQHR